jgi:phosphate transport system substrate-binding protein
MNKISGDKMQTKINKWLGATGVAMTLSAASVQAQTIKVDGSSTVYPITEAVAEEYGKVNRNVRVTVGISGTGGGFKKFTVGETDISNASRPIKATEAAVAVKSSIQYIELPVAYDALTVVVNKSNNWATNLTTAELKKIWEPGSKVRNWSQVRAGFPSVPLKLYGPGTDSGTFDYFTEAINGKEKACRTDFVSSEDDNVLVQGVARDRGALGYFGFAYYEENSNKLNAVAVNGVKPSIAAVNKGTYKPLARPLFIYVSKKAAGQPHVDKFVRYYLQNTAKLSKSVGYVPLPSSIVRIVQARYNRKTPGSVFGNKGAVVNMSLTGLLRKEGGK